MLLFFAFLRALRLPVITDAVPVVIIASCGLSRLGRSVAVLAFFITGCHLIEPLLVVGIEVGRAELSERLRLLLDQVVLSLLLRDTDTQSDHLSVNFRDRSKVTSVFCEVLDLNHVWLLNESRGCFHIKCERQAVLDVLPRLFIFYFADYCVKRHHLEGSV